MGAVRLDEIEERAVNRILSIIYGGRYMAKETVVKTAEAKTPPQTKRCGYCGQEKPLSEFYADKYSKSGYRSRCRGCCSVSTESKNGIITLNFNRIPNGLEMLETIRKEAGENFRDVDRQVLFLLKSAAVGGAR